MDSGRELFRKFLNRKPLPRPAFVPMIRGLLSRVEGIPMQRLTSDPTLWANSLMKTVRLFGLDGVVVGSDFTLVAEACGSHVTWKNDRPLILPLEGELKEKPEQSGRLRYALEVAGRLFELCRSELACVAAMTGPVTLASQLYGKEEGPKNVKGVKQLVVRVAEAFCRTAPDVLIFMEGHPLALAGPNATYCRIYNTLKNIAAYYNISPALYLQGYQAQGLSDFTKLRMDIYIPGPSLNKSLPSLCEIWSLGEGALGVGIGLPLDNLEKARETIHEGLRLHRDKAGQGFFFSSLGPATRDVNPDILHKLVNEISNLDR